MPGGEDVQKFEPARFREGVVTRDLWRLNRDSPPCSLPRVSVPVWAVSAFGR